MVKRTLEAFDCDVCGEEGSRYTIVFADGSLALDRCPRHGAKLEKLRDEKGSWSTPSAKTAFKVSTPAEIQAQKKDPRT
jgi:hypothetical protein